MSSGGRHASPAVNAVSARFLRKLPRVVRECAIHDRNWRRVVQEGEFRLGLDIAREDACPPPTVHYLGQKMATATNQTSVLVVEDDPGLNGLLSDLMEMSGYRVLRAFDGTVAYDLIGEEHPDIVTLDLMLPGMLGQEVLNRAKNDPATRDVRFVIVSACTQSLSEADRGLADALFSKPFEIDRLLEEVERLSNCAA